MSGAATTALAFSAIASPQRPARAGLLREQGARRAGHVEALRRSHGPEAEATEASFRSSSGRPRHARFVDPCVEGRRPDSGARPIDACEPLAQAIAARDETSVRLCGRILPCAWTSQAERMCGPSHDDERHVVGDLRRRLAQFDEVRREASGATPFCDLLGDRSRVPEHRLVDDQCSLHRQRLPV